MQINGVEQQQRGHVLLIAGDVAVRRRTVQVEPSANLAALSIVPVPVLLNSTLPSDTTYLDGPRDQNALLMRLRAAAATPGPLLIYLSGRLTVDRRGRQLYLALVGTTSATARYTALHRSGTAPTAAQPPHQPVTTTPRSCRITREGGAMEKEKDTEPLWSGAWEEMTVAVPVAASLLCLSPYTVGQLIEGGHLTAEQRGNFRFVTLVSLFAYRRRHWSPERARRYNAALDDATVLDKAAG
ncbi:hypothetical protein AB0G85_37915 [Streptomyces sioyaensis]|uniref:hypothetical protein n=1 Tax=Streptomyces sioyaensis TaxID=67364 RepID=UPI0033D533D6